MSGPRRRESELLVEEVGEELLLFDRARSLAHSLNDVAAGVWLACDGERDLDGLAARCGVDRHTVALALEQLDGANLLEEGASDQPRERADVVSRRAILRRGVLAGAGIGIAIPVIRSITAPSIAMATSTNGRNGNQVCGNAGKPCGSGCNASSFCNTARGSCQRHVGATCVNTSSCSHTSYSNGSVCRGGVCGGCTSNSQCPSSHPICDHSGPRCISSP